MNFDQMRFIAHSLGDVYSWEKKGKDFSQSQFCKYYEIMFTLREASLFVNDLPVIDLGINWQTMKF